MIIIMGILHECVSFMKVLFQFILDEIERDEVLLMQSTELALRHINKIIRLLKYIFINIDQTQNPSYMKVGQVYL